MNARDKAHAIDAKVDQARALAGAALARVGRRDDAAWGGFASRGVVTLVGAGPGDPELLTLRAVRALMAADAVVYDHLVNADILDLVPAGAEMIYAGKEAGRHALPQEETSHLLVALARRGHRVVRLKGGDPFIFGRGGEEIECLARHGVPFEVVPGITAAAGAGSAAGIPLTHRDHAQSCVFVTGHLKSDGGDLDWSALARPRQTVVIYMGLGQIDLICRRLVSHGLAAETPAAVIEHATLPQQRTLVATLADLPALAAREGARPPALIIVGSVVTLHHALSVGVPTHDCAPAGTSLQNVPA